MSWCLGGKPIFGGGRMKKGNLLLAAVIIAISATTAWSVYRSNAIRVGATSVAPNGEVKTSPTHDVFFKSLYRERLKEEGDRTLQVEKMVKDGKLSDKPARYTKSTTDLPSPTPPYKGGGKEQPQ